jgi:hypothetical protein
MRNPMLARVSEKASIFTLGSVMQTAKLVADALNKIAGLSWSAVFSLEVNFEDGTNLSGWNLTVFWAYTLGMLCVVCYLSYSVMHVTRQLEEYQSFRKDLRRGGQDYTVLTINTSADLFVEAASFTCAIVLEAALRATVAPVTPGAFIAYNASLTLLAPLTLLLVMRGMALLLSNTRKGLTEDRISRVDKLFKVWKEACVYLIGYAWFITLQTALDQSGAFASTQLAVTWAITIGVFVASMFVFVTTRGFAIFLCCSGARHDDNVEHLIAGQSTVDVHAAIPLTVLFPEEWRSVSFFHYSALALAITAEALLKFATFGLHGALNLSFNNLAFNQVGHGAGRGYWGCMCVRACACVCVYVYLFSVTMSFST